MIFYIILGIILIFSSIKIIKNLKKYRWFKSLKPGDEILVNIFSEYCFCYHKAIVTKSVYRKSLTCLIEAEIDKDTIEICKKCANEQDADCWSHVSIFSMYDVKPVKND